MNKIATIVALLLVAVLAVGVAHAVPVTIDEVQIDDTELAPNDVTRLELERGDEFEVEVRLSAFADAEDVEVEAFISGYEYNDDDASRLSDVTTVFDVEQNVTYVKRLNLKLPVDTDRDDYKVRVIVSDRNSGELIQNYNLKIDAKRHAIELHDVVVSPTGSVKAGSALLVTARVENFGEGDEEDVKVTAAIAELGISATDYIDEVDDDKQKNSEELYLRIPRCAEPGTYDLKVDTWYNRGRTKETSIIPITVIADESCSLPAANGPATTITLGNQLESAAQGATVVFPITLTNNGAAARSYTIAISNADWADVKLSPASTVVVDAGRSQTVNVFVTPKDDAKAGPQTLTASVMSGSEKLQDVTLTVNVSESKSGWDTLKRVLVVTLIVLVALLVILGLIIGVSRMKGQDDDGAKTQTYY